MPQVGLDLGIAGMGGNIPQNPGATGINGPLFSNAIIIYGVSPVTLNNAAGQTLTAAQMTAPLLDRSGAAAISDTTPTAAALVAALPGVKAGSSYEWAYRNRNSGTATIVAGSGVTSATGNTLTIPTVNTRWFLVVFTNVTPGSEAVTIYSVGASAH